MKRSWVVIHLLISLFGSSRCDESNEEVFSLSKDNFDSVIASNEYTLVSFCASWNKHCKILEPQYAKVAQRVAELNSDILIAKVELSEESSLADHFLIRRFPTMRLFKKAEFLAEYSGAALAEDIVKWLLRKTGSGAERITGTPDALNFANSSEVVVLGLFRDEESDSAKEFLKVAWEMDSVPFGITSDPELFQEHQISTDSVILFKKFDEGKATLDTKLTYSSITHFVKIESLPLLVQFSFQSLHTIFRGVVPAQLLLFIERSSPDIERIVTDARTLAKDFKGQVLFVAVDTENKDNRQLFDFFGLRMRWQFPCMRLTYHDGTELIKYKPEQSALTVENMREFVQGYLEGKLQPYLLSQPLPEDWDEKPVKVLVSSNFDAVVRDELKDVLVLFYAPWNDACKEFVPIYKELGDLYKDHPSVIVAKMDVTLNELTHMKINNYPTIKLFKGDNTVIDYTGERTLGALLEFLQVNTEEKDSLKREEL